MTGRGWLGLPGYLALWHLSALLEPANCGQLLAHLGFDYHAPFVPSRQPPLAPVREKKEEPAKRQTSKAVYSCLVVSKMFLCLLWKQYSSCKHQYYSHRWLG